MPRAKTPTNLLLLRGRKAAVYCPAFVSHVVYAVIEDYDVRSFAVLKKPHQHLQALMRIVSHYMV